MRLKIKLKTNGDCYKAKCLLCKQSTCILIAYPREFFILRNIVKKTTFKSDIIFSMTFTDIFEEFFSVQLIYFAT